MKLDKAKTKNSETLFGGSPSSGNLNRNINIFTENRKGEYYFISVDQLIPFHKQARQHFDSDKIDKLAQTIAKHGLRQPLTVIKSSQYDTKYEVVSGERRLRAAIKAQLEKVPCIMLQDISSAEEIAIIENIQREDLHPIELGKAYKSLIDSGFCASQSDVARILDVSRSQVVEYISYLNFSDEVKNALFHNKISDRISLRKLVTFENENMQLDWIYNNNKIRTLNKPKKSNIVSIFIQNDSILIEHKPLNQLSSEILEQLQSKVKSLLDELQHI